MSEHFDSSALRRYLRHGTLTQLAAFEAVVRMGGATRAADSLCLAQPTLSGHLRKLSETLDVRLFDLRGGRLVPTEAAQALLEAAHEVFAAFERCELTLADLRRAQERGDCFARAKSAPGGTGWTPRTPRDWGASPTRLPQPPRQPDR